MQESFRRVDTAAGQSEVMRAHRSEELEDVKLKMLELQLKLFEMQYLLNGGDPPKSE